MRLQQILNKMKKQEQKIYAIEKAIVKMEQDLKEVKKKWFHRKEQKELEGKIDYKGNKACESRIKESSTGSESMGCTGTKTGENVSEGSSEYSECGETGNAEKHRTEKEYS